MKLYVAMGAPDRRDAIYRLERIIDALSASGLDLASASANAHTVVKLCCQRAPYLATLLARDATRLARVAGDPYIQREKPVEVMASELAGVLTGCGDSPDALHAGLRRYRADEMCRLGVRELGLGNTSEVGRELAHLADVCFDAAIAFYDRRLRERHGPPRYTDHTGREQDARRAVIGMGTLGGEELNFSSDVDVFYIYSSDAGSAGKLSLPDLETISDHPDRSYELNWVGFGIAADEGLLVQGDRLRCAVTDGTAASRVEDQS